MNPVTLNQLGRYKEYGPIFLRLLVGTRLIYGTYDNVFSGARMEEFIHFLSQFGFPSPEVCAWLSVYAQFIGGILILLGAFIRPAALVMVLNFLVAISMVHLPAGDDFLNTYQALTMLFISFYFLLSGAGKLSVDEWLERRSSSPKQLIV